jgi:YegS/Rv2252/BmrU family lipid kinase
MQNENTHTWYLIANPAAGKNAVARRWQALQTFLQQHLPDHVAVLTTHRGHATALAQEAIQQGYRKIIAVGGDGTNFEVTNGILQQTDVPTTHVTYALLPVGTGNDWIRTHRIPKNWLQWLQMLQTGNTLLQDVGVVQYFCNDKPEQRFFVNVAGMAYDAFVVRYAERYKRWIIHKTLYLFMVVRCLFQYRLSRARVTFDEQTVEDYFYTINAGIGCYSGGGMRLVPHANPTDGQLALTLAGRVSKIGVLLNTYRFYNGTLGEHPQIDMYQTTRIRVEPLETRQPLWVEADGEFLGDAPVEIWTVPKALKVVVPGV